jgi:2-keto-4-pentenoate hydratase
MTALRLADGERLAGWKLGYTSAVMRAQMGIEAPNFGPLTDAMLLGSPAVLPAGALQPRVEPEIGLRLGRPLPGRVRFPMCSPPATRRWPAWRSWTRSGRATGSRWRTTPRTVVGRVGGSGSAAACLGPGRAAGGTVGRRSGGRRGTGAAASGHPALGVVWLAEQLAGADRRSSPGTWSSPAG